MFSNKRGKVPFPLVFCIDSLFCASAPGFYHFVKHYRKTIPLQIGGLFLIIAGASVTMMGTMQAACRAVFRAVPLEGAVDRVKER